MKDITSKPETLRTATARAVLAAAPEHILLLTVEVVSRLIYRELPGIVETARAYGQRRMPYAMLSRAVCGTIGETLVLTVLGRVSSVDEYLDALVPGIFHAFDMMRGANHPYGHKPR